jgi:hypothetical protein
VLVKRFEARVARRSGPPAGATPGPEHVPGSDVARDRLPRLAALAGLEKGHILDEAASEDALAPQAVGAPRQAKAPPPDGNGGRDCEVGGREGPLIRLSTLRARPRDTP